MILDDIEVAFERWEITRWASPSYAAFNGRCRQPCLVHGDKCVRRYWKATQRKGESIDAMLRRVLEVRQS